jgi:hypothetical protein
VTLTAEDRRTTVFRRGIEKASSLKTPTGGHEDPKSVAGPKDLWKNPQKNAAKKQASDKMKRIIP